MPKVTLQCPICGKEFERYHTQVKPINFCSRLCLGAAFRTGLLIRDASKTSKHMTEYNIEHNPTSMDSGRRLKLRYQHLGKGEGKAKYAKYLGRREHVYVAERILGRKLEKNEVVHHIDRNPRNNNPENLVVMTNSQHTRLHNLNRGKKEVMSDEFQALSVSAESNRLGNRS